MRSLFLLSFLFGGALSACGTSAPQVRTKNGIVEGYCILETPKEIHAFLGIPFAKPPLGNLRYKKPENVDDWSGVLSTKVQPPRCTQTTSDPISEDCLYLNVVKPAHGRNHPVFVIVHGGAFCTGSARQQGALGLAQNLAAKGLVVVAIQYRVGPLGFFSTGDSVLPGNYGLWDVKKSMEWIRHNIHKFGGDKDNILIFGGSAGGAIVDGMTMSPHTNTLFHKVFQFSAGLRDSFRLPIVALSNAKATALGLTWANSTDLRNQLVNVNASSLKAGWQITDENDFDYYSTDWGIRLDYDFFPADQVSMREAAPVFPRILGHTWLDEAIFTDTITITNETLGHILNWTVPVGTPNRTALQDWFRANYELQANTFEPAAAQKHAVQAALGDRTMLGTTKDVADRVRELSPHQKVWYYVFNTFNPASYGAYYPLTTFASHGYEQYYILGGGAWNYTANDNIVLNFFSRAVANFAKHSNPNGRGANSLRRLFNVTWDHQTNAHNDRYLMITTTPYLSDDYYGGRTRLTNQLNHQYGSSRI